MIPKNDIDLEMVARENEAKFAREVEEMESSIFDDTNEWRRWKTHECGAVYKTAGFTDESFGKTLSAVSALVNNATVRMTLDSGVFRTDLRLKDQDILYFAMKMAQDSIRMKTDILPDDAVIVMTEEDLASAGSMPAFPEVTAEDMKAAREAMEDTSGQVAGVPF